MIHQSVILQEALKCGMGSRRWQGCVVPYRFHQVGWHRTTAWTTHLVVVCKVPESKVLCSIGVDSERRHPLQQQPSAHMLFHSHDS